MAVPIWSERCLAVVLSHTKNENLWRRRVLTLSVRESGFFEREERGVEGKKEEEVYVVQPPRAAMNGVYG
jgi:hypothetical protein